MKPTRRYWDSNAFLAWLSEEPGLYEKCSGTIDAAEKGEIEIVTSALTLAEVIYLKGHPKISKEKSGEIIEFFKNEYILTMTLDMEVAALARELLWQHESLKPKDAAHVASAIKAHINRFDTFDEGLIKLSGKIGDPALIIANPDIPYQVNLLHGRTKRKLSLD